MHGSDFNKLFSPELSSRLMNYNLKDKYIITCNRSFEDYFKDNKKMNKTTVYRILDRLEEAGELHSFTDKDGLKRYAKNFSKLKGLNEQANHPHFMCQDCGISSCLPIEVSAPSIPNYTINNSEHLYIGHCNECNN